ncbi:lanthionine synthetase LanC family protein [Actinosynnema sp. NPDC050436]|uniref:class III lanthionine synthetase LanKC N-terminal domain-containing protein n=1 Tax=Actinosynnema sp. NPDC050436 TaxID=3155659 RepID=UPI0033C7ED04
MISGDPATGTVEAGSRAWVERLVRDAVGTGYSVAVGSAWVVARPAGASLPDQGWKLHVSSRVSTFPALVAKLVPLLAAEGCLFKLACSQEVLRDLNGGLVAPAAVGKAFTVYPAASRVRELGLALARALRGHEGPRVLSDRRVLANSPVYYRYGSLAEALGRDRLGRPEIRLPGPAGEEFDGVAGLSYRQPPWAVDPFAGAGTAPVGTDLLLGGRFRVTGGIRQAAQGNVFRAVDTRDGRPVVVKQARAHVAEYGERNDARLRLRNERRVLAVLAGVDGVPRFVDHFRHGDDEFLVTGDCGPRTLADDVQRHGPWPPGGGPRGWDRLAADLARVLAAVHDRGVVMRDLSPNNVVVGDGIRLVDFGLAAHDGVHLPGSTPGYAPARQARDEPPQDTDDLHALGAVLLFAATGLHPVTLGTDPDLPRTRALQTIRRRFGPAPHGVAGAVVDLLSGDADLTRDAARGLAAGGHRRSVASIPVPAVPAVAVSVVSVPAVPEVTVDLAADLTGRLLDDLLGLVDRVVHAPEHTLAANDVSAYTGSAGIGLELMRHLESRPSVGPRARELAEFTLRVAARADRPPGLFGGSTGTDLFLSEAARRGLGAKGWSGRGLPADDPADDGDVPPCDLVDGPAGVGLGHLHLHRLTGGAADLEVARRCADAVRADPVAGRTSAPGEADAGLGRAHGLAGGIALLLDLGHFADQGLLECAARRAHHLAGLADTLVAEAGAPGAEPMTVSWCRGLAGIGRTLAHAGAVLDDRRLTAVAHAAADACAARVPGLGTLGRCCGAVGVGEFLLDLADSERHRQAAFDVATHLLLRSSGPPDHPGFTAPQATVTKALSWAHGLTGILAFFRRLSTESTDGHPFT